MRRLSFVLLAAAFPLCLADVAVARGGAAPPAAGAAPKSGIYKINFGGNAGTMKVVKDGAFLCGTYAGDDGGGDGWLGGTLAGGTMTGLYTEDGDVTSNGLPITLAFEGNKLKGQYKEDNAMKAWTGQFAAAHPAVPNVSGDYSVLWDQDKLVLHVKQSGTTITATREYLYSGDKAGTMKGTISGNMVVGTWDDGDTHGRFQWTHATTRLAIDGTYGVDRDHCDNGGTIKGGKK